MPPKKGAAKAKTPVKAAAVIEPPSTITTARGKEIESTAAAGRPRRASAASKPVLREAPAKKAAPKAASTKAAAAPNTGKKRGRPAKAADDEVAEPPKKRGRPSADAAKPVAAPTKKAGRPAKKAKAAPAVALDEEAPPKRRGRPPKGGETTKIEAAEDAAAEQLEGELVEAVDEDAAKEEADEPRKQTSPVKKGRGRPKKSSVGTATKEPVENGVNGPQYWLMKAEQEDRVETLKDGSDFNAKFTIDDLRKKGGPEPWDGVRNPTACKNMKDMKLGDLAFFYASGGKGGRAPGITGIMEVVKEHEADPSAFDELSPFYVDNAKMRGSEDKPRWMMVHVEFRKKLSKPVFLTELKKYSHGNSVLAEMQEFTAARLSVSKVSEKEWNFIVDNLIEGYEDEAALPMTVNGDGIEAGTDGKTVGNGEVNDEANRANGVKETIESDIPTTDTLLTVDTPATVSRPASRAGSKQGGSRAASRAGSLAPPRPASRGRSRTPRAPSAQPLATVAEMEVVQE